MIIDFLFIFTMIFGYKIGLADFSIIIPSSIIISIILIRKIPIKTIPVLVFNFLIIFSLLIAISIISYLLNVGDFEPEYVLKPLRNSILVLVLYFFIRIRRINLIYLFKLLVYSLLVHSIVIYLQYLLYYYDIDRFFLYHPILTWSSPVRKVGLSTGFPSAGLMLVFSSLISLYLSFHYNSKTYFFISLIMGLSIFITARSAMYIYILIFPFYLIYLSKYHKKYSLIGWYITFILSIVSIISIYLLPVLQGSIDKMFINYINYTETGSFHDSSTKHLISSDHLFYPESIKTFLIGNSLNKQSGFQPSDISYVRIIMSIGIFGLLAYLMGYIYLFYSSRSNIRNEKDKSLKMLIALIFLSFFAMTFKGHYIFSRLVGDMILIISFGYIFADKKISTIPVK